MSIPLNPKLLRAVLWADALSGAATGAAQLAWPQSLAGWLGLPVALLQGSGALIFVFVALAATLALQPVPPRRPLALLAVGNLLWALGCAALAAGSLLAPTALGQAWLWAQALAVAGLAAVQWAAVRRGTAPAVPPGWA